MSCSGLSVANPLCVIAHSIGSLGSTVTSSVLSSVATAFGNTADSAINWLWSQMSAATSISLGGAAFELDLGIVTGIAAVLCVGLFVVQLVVAALARDGGGVGRAVRGLVVATVGCAITLASLDLVLAAVDQLCAGVVRVATGGSIATLGSKIIGPALFTGLVAGPGAILILSFVAIGAVAIVWFALVVRKMLIVISAVLAPLAFAGGVADLTRGWVRRWLEAMLALVFSKLILILIFVIGLGVLAGAGSPARAGGLAPITTDVTGLLILLVAGLSPWMALKLVHFTGEHMATLSASATHASSGAATVIGAPQKLAALSRATPRRLAPGGAPGGGASPPSGPLGADVTGAARDAGGVTAPAGAAAGLVLGARRAAARTGEVARDAAGHPATGGTGESVAPPRTSHGAGDAPAGASSPARPTSPSTPSTSSAPPLASPAFPGAAVPPAPPSPAGAAPAPPSEVAGSSGPTSAVTAPPVWGRRVDGPVAPPPSPSPPSPSPPSFPPPSTPAPSVSPSPSSSPVTLPRRRGPIVPTPRESS